MKKELLTAAAAVTLSAASSGAFAHEDPTENANSILAAKVDSGDWTLQQLVTACSNNGNNNNGIEVVFAGARCVRFETDTFDEERPDAGVNNNQLGEDFCATGDPLRDCDPKPVGAE